MTFSQAVQNAMSRWFSDGLTDHIKLNGADIAGHIASYERDPQAEKIEQSIDVLFRRADYPAIDYQSDRLEAVGGTWRWPRLVRGDAWTVTVRFVRDQRHRMRD